MIKTPPITEFYQMPDWAKLMTHDCISTEYITITDNTGTISISAQVYIYSLMGKYSQFFIPRGPIVFTEKLTASQIKEFWKQIDILANTYHGIFTTIEPPLNAPAYQSLWKNNTKISNLEKLPHQTQVIDLTLSQEELLQSMHQKMRYNIRLAERKGVQIHTINHTHPLFEHYFDAFFVLMQETRNRNNFAIHSRDHYYHLLTQHVDTIDISLIIAEYQDKVIAANIILDTETQRIYLHGASSHEYRTLMAPPLAQWVSILEAKKSGKLLYDLWGTSKTNIAWKGISRFKAQFGGYSIDYPSTQIRVHNHFLFSLYSLYRKLRGKSI